MSEESEKNTSTPPPNVPKTGLPLPIVLILISLVSIASGLGSFMMAHLWLYKPQQLTPHEKENGAEETESPQKEETEKKKTASPSQTYTFTPLQINIADPGEGGFVRVVTVIEFEGGDPQKNEIEAKKHILQDFLIQEIGQRSRQDLISPKQREVLKEDIEKRFNQILEHKINGIFFIEFLVD